MSRLGNGLKPDTDGFTTLVAWLRMPAEDFFSSDEERNDSKELPDLMAQLAPLLREDIRTTNDLRVAANTDHALEAAKRAWRAAPGQRSGITRDYALMLAQVPRVKADRMVISYVARAIDCPPSQLVPAKTAALVHGVAKAKSGDTIHSTTRSGILSPGAHSSKNQSRNRQRPNGLPLFVTAADSSRCRCRLPSPQ